MIFKHPHCFSKPSSGILWLQLHGYKQNDSCTVPCLLCTRGPGEPWGLWQGAPLTSLSRQTAVFRRQTARAAAVDTGADSLSQPVSLSMSSSHEGRHFPCSQVFLLDASPTLNSSFVHRKTATFAKMPLYLPCLQWSGKRLAIKSQRQRQPSCKGSDSASWGQEGLWWQSHVSACDNTSASWHPLELYMPGNYPLPLENQHFCKRTMDPPSLLHHTGDSP